MAREGIVRILDIIFRLRTARTFQERMDLIAEGISACGWKFVHFYVFDQDRKSVKSAAYYGFDEAAKKHLEANSMTLDEIEELLLSPENEQFKIGRYYHIPYNIWKDMDSALLRRLDAKALTDRDAQVTSAGWHPKDWMFIPLYGFENKPIGLVSADSPIDGEIPTKESLHPIKLFLDYATTYIEVSELEKYLSKSKTTLSQVFNLSPVAIVVSDENDIIIQINPAAEKMFDYSFKNVVGKPTSVLISPTEDLEHIAHFRKEGMFKNEAMMRKKDGKEFWCYIVNVPVMNLANEVKGYLLMALDIMEIKDLQYYLIRAEKMAGIGILASGIAHELNNPLYGILGLAEAIVDEDEVGIIKEYTNDIIEYAHEAAAIVKDLAGYTYTSRMETVSTVNVNVAIQNALKMIGHLGKLGKIEVVENYEDLPEINASGGELQQVFVNLITNAVDSMDEDGKLTLSTSVAGDFIETKVEDTGSGIPEDIKPHLFEPFFTTKSVGEGTGLGLYICYKIVNKYRGTIDFESGAGKGTTVVIRFPI